MLEPIRLLNDQYVEDIFTSGNWSIRNAGDTLEAVYKNLQIICDSDYLYITQDGDTSYFELNIILNEIREIVATTRHLEVMMYNGNKFVFTTGAKSDEL